MKIKFLLSLVLLLTSSSTWAQNKVEFATFYGYQFGRSVDVVRGKLSAPASGDWGFTLDVRRDHVRASL